MGYGYAYDPTGTKCSGGPMPGALALRDYSLTKWHALHDVGIYNCRPVRGGSSLSTHGEGRGWDAGVPLAHAPVGLEVADWHVAMAERIGVQEVIWDHHRWDSSRRRWLDYHGEDPHETHVHIALCRAAAAQLTVAAIRAADSFGPQPRRRKMLLIRKDGDQDVYLIGIGHGAVPVEGDDLATLEARLGSTVVLTGPNFDRYIKAAGGSLAA